MTWQPIPAIKALQRDLDKKFPNRIHPDWILGDKDHSSRVSDHNPAPDGDVHAIDIRLDGNIDAADVLAMVIGDPRVWYVIFDGHIYNRVYGWRKRVYLGRNAHHTHIHVSFLYDTKHEDDVAPYIGVPSPAKNTNPVVKKFETRASVQPGKRTIRLGSNGNDVAFVQRFLGLSNDDGLFGNQTEQAVRRYQKMRGLKVDGIIGNTTWKNILS